MNLEYKLGNFLRGYVEGLFPSQEKAWSSLSHRYLQSYPAPDGRHVEMLVMKENEYDLLQWVRCQQGVTEIKGDNNDSAN